MSKLNQIRIAHQPLRFAVAAALAVCVVAPAYAATGSSSSTGPTTSSSTSDTVKSSDTGKPGNTAASADKTFLTKAMNNNRKEILVSQMALERASSEQVRNLAQHMIQDHSNMLSQVHSTAVAVGVLPASSASSTAMGGTGSGSSGMASGSTSTDSADTNATAMNSGPISNTGSNTTGTGAERSGTTGYGTDASDRGSDSASSGSTGTGASTASSSGSTTDSSGSTHPAAGSTGSAMGQAGTASGAISSSGSTGSSDTGSSSGMSSSDTSAAGGTGSGSYGSSSSGTYGSSGSMAAGGHDMAGITEAEKAKLKNDPAMKSLASKQGAEFDRAFVAQMVKDHQKNISEFTTASTNSALSSETRSLATQALPKLREHLAMVQSVQSSLGTSSAQ